MPSRSPMALVQLGQDGSWRCCSHAAAPSWHHCPEPHPATGACVHWEAWGLWGAKGQHPALWAALPQPSLGTNQWPKPYVPSLLTGVFKGDLTTLPRSGFCPCFCNT